MAKKRTVPKRERYSITTHWMIIAQSKLPYFNIFFAGLAALREMPWVLWFPPVPGRRDIGIDKKFITPYNNAMFCTVADTGAKAPHVIRNIPPFPAIVAVLLFFTLIAVDRANAQPGPSTFRLIGTVTAGGFTGAVLDDAKGEQTFYRLYEILPDGSKLVKVKNDSILLKRNDGALYEIYMSHDTKTAVQQVGPPAGASPPPPVIAPSGPATDASSPRKRRRMRRSSEEDE